MLCYTTVDMHQYYWSRHIFQLRLVITLL